MNIEPTQLIKTIRLSGEQFDVHKKKQRAIMYMAAIFCAIMAIAGVTTTYHEVSAALSHQYRGPDNTSNDGSIQYSVSSHSKRRALLKCTDLLLYNGVESSEFDRGVATTCQQVSRNITDRMPTNSHAWFVNALSRSKLGDKGGFLISHKRAFATAPNEIWLARYRAQLAAEEVATLDKVSADIFIHDLSAIGYTEQGLETLGELYRSSSQIREYVIQSISRLPPSRQRAFLRLAAQS